MALQVSVGLGVRLVSQIPDFIFVQAEEMRDLVEHRQADLFAQLFGVGKILKQRLGENCNLIWQNGRVESGAVGERDALVESVKCVVPRVEPLGAQ